MMMMRFESTVTDSHTAPTPNRRGPKPDKRMTGSNLIILLLMIALRLGTAEHVSGKRSTRFLDSKPFKFSALKVQRFPKCSH